MFCLFPFLSSNLTWDSFADTVWKTYSIKAILFTLKEEWEKEQQRKKEKFNQDKI